MHGTGRPPQARVPLAVVVIDQAGRVSHWAPAPAGSSARPGTRRWAARDRPDARVRRAAGRA